MAGVLCPVSSSTLPGASVSLKSGSSRHSAGEWDAQGAVFLYELSGIMNAKSRVWGCGAGAVSLSTPGWGRSERACGGPPLVHTSSRPRPFVVCKALDKGASNSGFRVSVVSRLKLGELVQFFMEALHTYVSKPVESVLGLPGFVRVCANW